MRNLNILSLISACSLVAAVRAGPVDVQARNNGSPFPVEDCYGSSIEDASVMHLAQLLDSGKLTVSHCYIHRRTDQELNISV